MRTPKVLIEHENPHVCALQVAALEAAGFDVLTCAGPAWRDDGLCPLVAHGFCRKVYAADVILNELPLGQLPVYIAQRAHLRDRPVLLGLSESEQARHPILESLATRIPRTVTGDQLVAVVRAELDG